MSAYTAEENSSDAQQWLYVHREGDLSEHLVLHDRHQWAPSCADQSC